MPKISVIIPIYRVCRNFLEQCLASVNKQTLNDFEVLLVLNGSTEIEQSVCEAFYVKDPRFKIFETDNADVSVARNIGLDHAEGKYVTFLDCDDWLSNEAFQKFYDLMENSHAEIGIANTQKIWKNGDKKTLFKFYDHVEQALLKRIPHVGVWSFILKNDIISKNHIRFKEGLKLSEDRVFLFEYYLHCKKIAFTNDIVYFYRQHNSSVCKAKQTHEHAIQQLKAAVFLHDILRQSSEFSHKDICHLDRILTRMGMVAYINSGTTKEGFLQLKDFFFNNISHSKLIFYYCWYRAKVSALIGRLLCL